MPWKVPDQAKRVGHDAGVVAHHLAGDPLDPLRHLGGGAARERHQQDAARIGAVDDQMGDAMGQRVGLAGSGAGDHQQRRERARPRCAVLDGAPLFRIEAVEVGGCRLHGVDGPCVKKSELRDSPRGHNDFRIFWREVVAPEPDRPIDSYRLLIRTNKNNPFLQNV